MSWSSRCVFLTKLTHQVKRLELCFILWTNRPLVFVSSLFLSNVLLCVAKKFVVSKRIYLATFTNTASSSQPTLLTCENSLAHHYNYSTNKEQYYVMNSERFTSARSSRTRCSRLVVVHRGNSQTITFHHLVGKSNRLQQVDQTNEHITFDWFYGLASLQKAEDCRESWTVEVYRDLTPRRAKSLRSGGCWERCFVRLHAPHPANRSLPRSLSV